MMHLIYTGGLKTARHEEPAVRHALQVVLVQPALCVSERSRREVAALTCRMSCSSYTRCASKTCCGTSRRLQRAVGGWQLGTAPYFALEVAALVVAVLHEPYHTPSPPSSPASSPHLAQMSHVARVPHRHARTHFERPSQVAR